MTQSSGSSAATPPPRRRRGTAGRLALAFGAASMLSACQSVPPPAADGRFALEEFFRGSSVSRGEIRTLAFWSEDFTAGFSGETAEGVLRLDERFHFKDGERLQRWNLKRVSQGRYEGTVETENGDGALSAPVPVAGYRTSDGAVLDYDGYAPGGGGTVLHFRHWMESRPDGSVLNRVRISKFGIPIAGASVVFSKVQPGS